MNSYELMYILDADLTDDKRSALIEKFSNLIVSLGGALPTDPAVVEKLNKLCGMKKFAYAINFKTEGYYVVNEFAIAGDKIAEIERQLRITDGVVRHMVVRK